MYVIHKIFEYHAPNPIFALLYLFVVLFAHFFNRIDLFLFRAIYIYRKRSKKHGVPKHIAALLLAPCIKCGTSLHLMS